LKLKLKEKWKQLGRKRHTLKGIIKMWILKALGSIGLVIVGAVLTGSILMGLIMALPSFIFYITSILFWFFTWDGVDKKGWVGINKSLKRYRWRELLKSMILKMIMSVVSVLWINYLLGNLLLAFLIILPSIIGSIFVIGLWLYFCNNTEDFIKKKINKKK